jgi:Lipopolysaccharide-assembly
MIPKFIHFTALAAVIALTSCAGYQLGGVKPASLSGVKNIAVPMFDNKTQHPRAGAMATSACTHTLVQDGTYRITSLDKADAVLEASLQSINYTQIRGSRVDSLFPEELGNTVTIVWQLRNARDPSQILAQGTSFGTSQLFVSSNLQTARNNALPEALERASEALVSTLASGY